MPVGEVPGTQGYEKVVDRFIEASQALDFSEANKDFLEFLPCDASRVLDVFPPTVEKPLHTQTSADWK